MEVAKTIFKQINMVTKMAVAARDWVGCDKENYLQFRITISRGTHHVIRVALNAMDEYDVTLYKIKRKTYECITEAHLTGVGVENLNETIYRLGHPR